MPYRNKPMQQKPKSGKTKYIYPKFEKIMV